MRRETVLLIFSDNVPQDIEYCCSHQELEDSYVFCRQAGVPVELKKPRIMLPKRILAAKLKSNTQLLDIMSGLINPIIQSGVENDYIFILCDRYLAALKIFSTLNNAEAAQNAGIVPGTVFSEKSCGTNALSLTKRLGRIVTITGDQHYCSLFKAIYCVAGPVASPGGDILGYLDISRPIIKEIGPSVALIKTLLTAAEKEILFGARSLAGLHAQPFLPPKIKQELTPREQEICLLMLKRLSSREIATQLHLSVSTVRSYRKNIYQKLAVNGLTGLLTMLGH